MKYNLWVPLCTVWLASVGVVWGQIEPPCSAVQSQLNVCRATAQDVEAKLAAALHARTELENHLGAVANESTQRLARIGELEQYAQALTQQATAVEQDFTAKLAQQRDAAANREQELLGQVSQLQAKLDALAADHTAALAAQAEKHKAELAALADKNNADLADQAQEHKAEVDKLKAQQEEFKKQAAVDLGSALQSLQESHTRERAQVQGEAKAIKESKENVERDLKKFKEQSSRDLQVSKQETDAIKETLKQTRQELLQARERVLQLEKELSYYWDLYDEYLAKFMTEWNRLVDFCSKNPQIQAVYQPTKAGAIKLWGEVLKHATPVYKEYKPKLDKHVETVKAKIPPPVVEKHSLVSGHFCVGSQTAAAFLRQKKRTPVIVLEIAGAVERNCATVLLYIEGLLVAYFVSFILGLLFGGRGAKPKKPSKKAEAASSNNKKSPTAASTTTSKQQPKNHNKKKAH